MRATRTFVPPGHHRKRKGETREVRVGLELSAARKMQTHLRYASPGIFRGCLIEIHSTAKARSETREARKRARIGDAACQFCIRCNLACDFYAHFRLVAFAPCDSASLPLTPTSGNRTLTAIARYTYDVP